MQKGGERALIAVLPWVQEFKIADICQTMKPMDTWYKAYSDNVAAMCQHLAAGFTKATVNILAAHFFASKPETSGSERAKSRGATVRRETWTVAERAAVHRAGTHSHQPQEVNSASRCFYSGSPLQLDFGERGQQKRVLIIDAKAGFPANIESINLTAVRKFMRHHHRRWTSCRR